MRAAIYARYSSDNQRATSIEDQTRNCRHMAEREGWIIAASFADAAISGSDANRPQYQAMLEAAKRNQFDVLLVDDLSRFARDSVEQEQSIRRLEFQGIRIIGISDGYDSESKARKIHRGVKGLMNEIFLDDLAEKVHRGLTGQAERGFWCGGRPYGYNLRPILDPNQTDAYGQPAKIGTKLEVNEEQAPVVREMFQRFIDGQSHRSIASELNRRGVPSPGSTWKRRVRRCRSWVGSAVRSIVTNPLYTGRVIWNKSQFVRDPDTGEHKRRKRPQSEWCEHRDETLRIVSDAKFKAAQERTRDRRNRNKPIKTGGKAKYLLSGLLKCSCGSTYVMVNERSYGCGGHREGACDNAIRVRRDRAEKVILDPIRDELLAPDRVARMARELQKQYLEWSRAMQAKTQETPAEIQALDARISRLRERQRVGDPDMTADELQVVIDRIHSERKELEESLPTARQGARIAALLPNAAELYRKQIALGLDGDARAALKARAVLRKICGTIVLEPGDNGSLWANYDLQPAALLRSGVTGGRGERI